MHAPRAGETSTTIEGFQRVAMMVVDLAKRTARAGRDQLTRRRLGWRLPDPPFRRRPETNEDPVLMIHANAPVDDEPLSDDDRMRLREGREAFRSGNVLSAEEVKRACLGARAEESSEEIKRAAI